MATERQFRPLATPMSPVTKFQSRRPSAAVGFTRSRPDVKEGYCEKQNKFGVWQRRYFAIRNHYLVYYSDDKMNEETGGQVDLQLVDLVSQESRLVFLHLGDSTKYKLRFASVNLANEWREKLKQIAIQPTKPTAAAGQKKPADVEGPLTGAQTPSAAAQSPTEAHSTTPGAEAFWMFFVCGSSLPAILAVLPMPTQSLWLIKIGLFAGVLHATVIKTYLILFLMSLGGLLLAKASPEARRQPRKIACWNYSSVASAAAVAVCLFPTLAALPKGMGLPAQVDGFLEAAKAPAPDTEASAFSLLKFWRDQSCAVTNSWSNALPTEVVFKEYDPSPRRKAAKGALATVETQIGEETSLLVDWTGFGDLYEGNIPGKLKVALFKPESEVAPRGGFPVVVSVHGGGWYSGSMYEGLQCYLPQILSAGWAVAAPEFRLGSRGWRGKHMVEDLLDLVTWVRGPGRSRYGLNADRLILMGGSTGAHLALVTGYMVNHRAQKQVVKGVVARYGPVDLVGAHVNPSTLGLGTWNESTAVVHLTGGVPEEAPRAYTSLSPLSYVGKFSPPTIMLHCRQDEFFSATLHADALQQALSTANVPNLLIDPHFHSHGCDIGSTAPFQFLSYALDRFMDGLANKP